MYKVAALIVALPIVLSSCTTSDTTGRVVETPQDRQDIQAQDPDFSLQPIGIAKTSNADGYTIFYPAYWKLMRHETNEGTDLQMNPPPIDSSNADVLLVVDAQSKADRLAIDIATSMRSSILQSYPEASVRTESLTINGAIAARVGATNIHVLPGQIARDHTKGTPGNYTEMIIEGQKTLFRIIYTAPSGDDLTNGILETIARTFAVQ